VGAAAAALAALLVEAGKWNPVLSYDTGTFYYPSVARSADGGAAEGVLSAFLVPPDARPEAHQAKPVFVALLRLWHGTAARLAPATLPFPSDHVYSAFIGASYLCAFLCACVLTRRAGIPYVGLTAAGLAFFSPWLIAACYFNSYTAPSLVLLFGAVFLLLPPRPRPLWAGALCALNLQTNQSTIVFSAAMAVLLLAPPADVPTRARLLLRLAAGFAAAWLGIDAAILLVDAVRGTEFLPETVVLWRYLGRSRDELSGLFDVYRGSLLPLLLWEHSRSLTVSAVFGLAIALAAAVGGARLGRRGIALLAYVLAVWLLIDARRGPKFSRTYVLLLPFVTLLVVAGAAWLWRRSGARRPAVAALVSVLVAALAAEEAAGLRDFRAAALAVRDLLVAGGAEGETVYVSRRDSYLPFFAQLVEDRPLDGRRLAELDDVCALLAGSRGPVTVAVGPNVPSILNFEAWGTGRVEDLPLPPRSQAAEAPSGTCPDGGRWRARHERSLPFFAHHPFLVLEDPMETYRLLRERHYTLRSYEEPYGEVTVWRVSAAR
jgi:hypothetical protein